jgi:hypothetical protein
MTTNEQLSTTGQPEEPVTPPESASPGQETSSTPPETQPPLTEAEKAKAVADLLNGADSATERPEEPPGDPDDPAPAPEPKSAPKTLSELAETLGASPEDVYKIELTTGDGEVVSIGDLKDGHRDRQAAQRETAEREAALDQRETAIIAEQRVWASIGESLEQSIPPEAREQLAQQMQERDRVERRRLMDAAPELQDQAKFEAFREDVVKTLGEYGYKPHEIVVGDHRQLMVLRDLIRTKKRLKDLLEYKPKQSPPGGRKPTGRGNEPDGTARAISKAKSSPHEADKVAAVAALLKG